MRLLSLAVVGLCLSPLTAAGQTGQVQKTIDEQVWRPFQHMYASLDATGFLDLHTANVVRIIQDSKKILTGETFWENVRQNVANARKNNVVRRIDFRFTRRFSDGLYAFEQGFYKVVSQYGQDEQYVFYGKFDVVLHQENGHWKIMLDADTSENGKITEADFLTGTSME